jgi:UDP-galactopyranose mutase
MNHCDDTVDYTRVIEHKHFNPLPDQKGTYVSYEYSCEPTDTIDPYYPVNVASEREKMKYYEALKDLAKPNVHICGRLGDFKYYDMHQAIGIVFKDLPEIRKRIFEHNNRW